MTQVQSQAFGVVVRVANVGKVHVVHVLVTLVAQKPCHAKGTLFWGWFLYKGTLNQKRGKRAPLGDQVAELPVCRVPPVLLHLFGVAAGHVRAVSKDRQAISLVVVHLALAVRLVAIWRCLEALVLLIFDDVLGAITTFARGASHPATLASQQVAQLALHLQGSSAPTSKPESAET